MSKLTKLYTYIMCSLVYVSDTPTITCFFKKGQKNYLGPTKNTSEQNIAAEIPMTTQEFKKTET